MTRLSIWGGPLKKNDYTFFDKNISEFFHASGTAAYVHLSLGPYPQTGPTGSTGPTGPAYYPVTGPTGPSTADQTPGSPNYLYDYPEIFDGPNGSPDPKFDYLGYTQNPDTPSRSPTIKRKPTDPDWDNLFYEQNPGGTPILNDDNVGTSSPDGALFDSSGTSTVPANGTTSTTGTSSPATTDAIASIQDLLFLENRDIMYDRGIHEIRITYQLQDADFDLTQFGITLSTNTIFLETHFNDMIAICGRKIVAGDVLELPHLRDSYTSNPVAINAFYVVQDAYWAADGFSATWLPHIWRMKLTTMTNSQQYADILAQNATDPFGLSQGTTLASVMTTLSTTLGINDAVVAEAAAQVRKRNFETQQFYIVPGDELGNEYPWVFAGDGIPPNNALPIPSGNQFPANPSIGDYYLRTDYQPNTLFRYDVCNCWKIQELNFRQDQWSSASRLLRSFIDNDSISTFDDGTTQPTKQPLYKAILPRADFLD